jgi:hypothetical protein
LLRSGEDAVEVADILRDHVKRSSKGRPGSTGDRVRVTDAVDVNSLFVDFGMNVKTRCVDGQILGSGAESQSIKDALALVRETLTYPVTAYNCCSVDVQADHVTRIQ